ncbi:ribosome assembly cofactor RimP [Nonlabens sp. Ci31]|jgi:ribosome maturation factor RimP|uniref:ribosome assembly cofactor RimP n=1 Tax=Nonlabens sp. Ci31 TaxID=2608253 RepID=UPI0014645806|nr:ribosome assembly cofactor RimP [Nonlabens sp. Ci31]QJP33539.1 ribosome assembly cofactor RimP [Nonlabens sp. Ci31]
MLKEKVEKLLKEAFEERADLFLIDFKMGAGNEIKVIIDGDDGVKLSDCMFFSRAVEHNLDREEYDFSIEVLSAGASSPLSFPRQFIKNLGRDIQIVDREKRTETGLLKLANEEGITIVWKAREPKPIGKGKVTVEKEWALKYEDIKQAKVVIKFN